jgi:hypothetical protein
VCAAICWRQAFMVLFGEGQRVAAGGVYAVSAFLIGVFL